MATVVGGDPYSDLAVLKLEGQEWDLLPATLGDSDGVQVGQMAVAIGAPFGQEFTMTSGIVSGVGRVIRGEGQFTVPKIIQTDAAINPGNSGGPLLDRHGRVIGINTQILSRTGDFSGVGMAVPVNLAARIVPHLIDGGEYRYPWLGVSISTITASYAGELQLSEGTRGALIAAVVENSPADRAGLRGSDSAVSINGVDYPAGGDIVIAIDSYNVNSSNDLIAPPDLSLHPRGFRDFHCASRRGTRGNRGYPGPASLGQVRPRGRRKLYCPQFQQSTRPR